MSNFFNSLIKPKAPKRIPKLTDDDFVYPVPPNNNILYVAFILFAICFIYLIYTGTVLYKKYQQENKELKTSAVVHF